MSSNKQEKPTKDRIRDLRDGSGNSEGPQPSAQWRLYHGLRLYFTQCWGPCQNWWYYVLSDFHPPGKYLNLNIEAEVDEVCRHLDRKQNKS